MIPDFDQRGNLPPGIHRAEFSEVVQRFGGSISLKRRSLTNTLETFYDFVKSFAIRICIDGSYVTSKLAPQDVDLIVILPDCFDFNSHKGRRLLGFSKDKHLHLFPIKESQKDNELKWVCWFTKDRDDNPKGIILVEVKND